MKTHKDLEVWKNSINLITTIYTVTKSYPKEEIFGLTNQMRRSAVSISSNIAEGAARNSKKDFIHFLHIARGSLAELETQIIVSHNLNYLTGEAFKDFEKELKLIGAQLSGLIKSLKDSIPPVTQSPSHPVTQSPNHPITQSPSHPVTQSPSHQSPSYIT